MGSVCSSGLGEKKNKTAEEVVVGKNKKKKTDDFGSSWKLKKKKSFVNINNKNKKGSSDSYYSTSSSATNGVKKQKKKKDSGFAAAEKQASQQRGSFLGRAGERAVDVLDILGSNMPKLSTSNNGGFNLGIMFPRGQKISILAFEVANTINKGAILFQSLSEDNIQFLKKEILQSEGLHHLVSADTNQLLSLVEADKREEFNAFSKEVVRFGNMCKENQWHNLDRYFSRLDLDALDHKQPKVDAEKTMHDLIILAQTTAELYHELTTFDRFEQDYQIRVKEMESLNLPLKGDDSLTIFQSGLKQQRRIVKSLQKKSLWSRNLEEIVEKFVDIVTYLHQAISKFLGNHGTTSVKYSNDGSQRLGEVGLPLHYANIINQINAIASRPSSFPSNIRDTLYQGLPKNIKNALPSKLQNVDVTKEVSMTQVKVEMDKTLQWLTPLATNTTKAHQGFGWVGEWANGGNEFGVTTTKENNLIRLQTLHYAEKQKIDFYIIELLVGLHNLVTFVRYKHNNYTNKKPNPTSSNNNNNPKKGLDFQSRMLQFITLESERKKQKGISELSQEDKSLLDEVLGRGRTPGVSKSENFTLKKKKIIEANVLYSSKSVGNSPHKGFATLGIMELQNPHALDVMDGLRL